MSIVWRFRRRGGAAAKDAVFGRTRFTVYLRRRAGGSGYIFKRQKKRRQVILF